jgi:hypothetical protein
MRKSAQKVKPKNLTVFSNAPSKPLAQAYVAVADYQDKL